MTRATVLVVDDNPEIRALVVQALEDEDYTVLATADQDGITQAQAARPQVILLDLMMPQMDGATVSQHLRADPATRDIPIVALSARPRASAPAGFMVDDWLAKPFGLDELYAMVERWCAGREGAG